MWAAICHGIVKPGRAMVYGQPPLYTWRDRGDKIMKDGRPIEA